MPPIPPTLGRLAPLDRSFEIAHDHERAIAVAFEAALPIIRRRPDRVGRRREGPAAAPGGAAATATPGR